MTTATAIPGNMAATYLTHIFGRGLEDECYVVERFQAMTDGDIRRCPGDKAKRVIAIPQELIQTGATPRGRCGVCENRRRPMPVPGPRRGGSLPSASVSPDQPWMIRARRRMTQKKQDMTGMPVVNQNGGSCESTPHVVFTVRYWHEPVDSHRKCASESRAVFQVAPRWISPWRPWRRDCFFKAVLRFNAACRPPNSSRIQTAP